MIVIVKGVNAVTIYQGVTRVEKTENEVKCFYEEESITFPRESCVLCEPRQLEFNDGKVDDDMTLATGIAAAMVGVGGKVSYYDRNMGVIFAKIGPDGNFVTEAAPDKYFKRDDAGGFPKRTR